MIKLPGIGSVEERLAKIEQSINRSTEVMSWRFLGESAYTITTSGTLRTVFHSDYARLRTLVPAATWSVYALGYVDPGDANGVLLELLDNDLTVLGSLTLTGAGVAQASLGPFSFPAATTSARSRLLWQATKITSGTATIGAGNAWTAWLELRAPR